MGNYRQASVSKTTLDWLRDNYAKENWPLPDENPPVGLILYADKGHALARYALDGLPSKIMATNYKTVLPEAELLQKSLRRQG